MKVFTRAEYQILPWKNNLGITELIATDSNELFSWRLSAATITGPSLFSEYPGYKRWLTIWKGSGLLLNEYKLTYGLTYEFNGEEKITCKNLSAEIVDLGLIYNPKKVKAKMEIVNLNLKNNNFTIEIKSQLSFLFVCQGSIEANMNTLNEGDTLKSDTPQKINLKLKTHTSDLVLITIDPKKSKKL
ncbi:MAG: HutD family protein [Bdellovibrionaceae bacterium]|nr:HutD family protein [Pseudobdellovibrionaceae bacterium]NUM57595.1 HutD family protein [Pseudobdellovibrionaceae bacterium]